MCAGGRIGSLRYGVVSAVACHLNRAIRALIEEAGFQFDRLGTGYMRGPKPMTFMYEGSARPM
jgi:hypothetical protein